MSLHILIIEDEKLTAADLAATIRKVRPDVTIVATVGSVAEGRAFFTGGDSVDLIFSDIQLGDGLSFDIFETTRPTAPVIFCTAYDDYALRAFKSLGIDYILKPFSMDSVAAALDKFETIRGNSRPAVPDYQAVFEGFRQQLEAPKRQALLLYRRDKIIPLDVDCIALFFIEDDTVFAQTFDGERWATDDRMEALEQQLAPRYFRANRQVLVNRSAVKEASRDLHRKLRVHLTCRFHQTVLVGKEKVPVFLEWLQNQSS